MSPWKLRNSLSPMGAFAQLCEIGSWLWANQFFWWHHSPKALHGEWIQSQSSCLFWMHLLQENSMWVSCPPSVQTQEWDLPVNSLQTLNSKPGLTLPEVLVFLKQRWLCENLLLFDTIVNVQLCTFSNHWETAQCAGCKRIWKHPGVLCNTWCLLTNNGGRGVSYIYEWTTLNKKKATQF